MADTSNDCAAILIDLNRLRSGLGLQQREVHSLPAGRELGISSQRGLTDCTANAARRPVLLCILFLTNGDAKVLISGRCVVLLPSE